MKRTILGLLIAMTTMTPAPSAAPEKPVSIVLVHGAFADASGWRSVYDTLTRDGYEVLMVQNATITLAGDVATTRQVIARAKHPVILVGHSYGGAVITEAGTDPKVKRLVYFAAFAPDAGETVLELATKPTPGEDKAPLLPPNDGFIIVDPDKFPSAFAADVDPALTRFMAASQVPWGLGAVQTAISRPAWKDKPAHFMLTTQDHMIPPSAQRAMATRAKAKLVELPSGHAVMLSHPADVAAFIESAAVEAK
jgi:pimeloyl-ACP methyl ester carboxylesterase